MKRAEGKVGGTSRAGKAEAGGRGRAPLGDAGAGDVRRELEPSDPLADLFLGPRNPGALAPGRLEAARRRARRLRSFLDAGGAHLAPRELRAAAIEAVEELDAVLAAATALLDDPLRLGGNPEEEALEALRSMARSIRSHARAMLAESAFSQRPASDWRHLEPISRAAERLPTLVEALERGD